MDTIYRKYQRKGLSEMRPYIPSEIWDSIISVSAEDLKNGSPKEGDMIARNPKNHGDQWLVAKKYFDDNLELVHPVEPQQSKCEECPSKQFYEANTAKIMDKIEQPGISVTDKEVTYMTYFPSKDQIRNMALDIVGYDKDQPQLITQEMAVNFITIFAKWLRDKLKANS